VTGEDVVFKKNGPIAYVVINREEALNSLNSNVLAKLDIIFSEIEHDDEIVVVIITGAGQKAFVAGADVKEIKNAGANRTSFIAGGQCILSKIRNSSKVVIAAINGYALGGGFELALACDIRIASENARLGLPEATLGVMAGYGGTQLLPRLIGPGKAKYAMFSGAMFSAAEAYQLGLVEKVYESKYLMEEVEKLARKIAAAGPLAIKGCKRAIDEGMEFPIDDALEIELEIYEEVANSNDAEEGLSAFLEKRKPVFKGM
jgi:enoyl-CoA hydratase